jgi:HSP20 family protein
MARVPSLFSPGSLLGAGAADPFLTLHREMNRLFDDVLRGGPVPEGGQGGSSQGGVLLAPRMDVSETDNEVRIQAELPGVSENDIDVSLNEDLLTIRAEKKQERKEERQGLHFSERSFGTFQRSLRCHSRSTRTRCKPASRMACSA